MKYLIYTALLLPLFTFGFEIRLPEDAAVVEKKAAEELKNHLERSHVSVSSACRKTGSHGASEAFPEALS